MSHRNTIEDVENLFKLNNLILLDKDYKNAHQKLLALNPDGFKVVISYNKLQKGRIPNPFHINNPYTIENIRLWVKNNKPQYILLSTEYKGNKNKLLWFCTDCNSHFECSWSNFRKCIYSCNKCYPFKQLSHKEFIKRLKNSNEKFRNNKFRIDSEYISMYAPVKCVCNICGNVWLTNPKYLIDDGTGCRVCYDNNNHGENSPNWNPDLTNEERELRRRLAYDSQHLWSKRVFEKYNYTCDILHIRNKINLGFTVKLNAHHLNGYHWDKENRFEVDNGVCLCEPIHKLFHHIYGSKNNTKEQYYEFKDDTLKGKYNDYQVYDKTIGYFLKHSFDII